MSTPQGMIPPAANAAPAPTTPNLYNQISSAGVAGQGQPTGENQQPQQESLVDKATKRFGAVFSMFTDLTDSYPGEDKEAQLVKDSMANWLNTVANKINEQGGSSN